MRYSLYNHMLQMMAANSQKGDWSLFIKMLGQFFFFIVVCIVVVIAAFYITKFVGSAKYIKDRNQNMRVVESIYVGQNATVQIVFVSNRCFLIGVTKENITLLSELNKEDINEIKPETNFKFLLNRQILKSKNKSEDDH